LHRETKQMNDAVICVYDAAGKVIETHKHAGDGFGDPVKALSFLSPTSGRSLNEDDANYRHSGSQTAYILFALSPSCQRQRRSPPFELLPSKFPDRRIQTTS